MAGDRRAALILQAAASGVIDFSQFDPYDRSWWTYLKWMLREVERDNFRKLLATQHLQHVGALARDGEHWKDASEIIEQLVALYYPWLKPGGPKTRKQDIEEAKKILSKKFGDPNTPEGAERIKRTVEYLQGKRPACATPNVRRPKAKKRR